MKYHKFSPCQVLRPFVECYFVWEDETAVSDLVVESPPNGFCSMVFNSGDPYFLQNKKYDRLAVPLNFVSGQSIYSYKLFLHGRLSLAGIVFHPAALASFFDLPTYLYTEERVPLGTIFPGNQIGELAKKLAGCVEPNEKVKLLEDFLLGHYKILQPVPDKIDEAVNLIVEKNGMLDVSEIMKNSFMSRRNFERKFFKKVGLSPKYYARLRRMSFLLNQIAGKRKADWTSLFSDCEFYDQSHFIKDFMAFTGRTPQQYLAHNSELANFIDKPTQSGISY
ncbi:MAG TPA: helix-turn-helix domain-containing protein [Flavitalea sp.]|nr:helix-turn-helix domain-containing protein [Flavitalea sp.]